MNPIAKFPLPRPAAFWYSFRCYNGERLCAADLGRPGAFSCFITLHSHDRDVKSRNIDTGRKVDTCVLGVYVANMSSDQDPDIRLPLLDTLVTVKEISDITGVTSPAVSNWLKRNSDFPNPARSLASGNLYRLGEVVSWLDETGRSYTLPSSPIELLWSWANTVRRDLNPNAALQAILQVLAIRASLADRQWRTLETEENEETLWTKVIDALVAVTESPDRLFRIQPDDLVSYPEGSLSSLVATVASVPAEAVKDMTALVMERLQASDRETYTPSSLADLLLALLEPGGDSLLDPAAGLAAILARAADRSPGLAVYAQDINLATSVLGGLHLQTIGADFDYRSGDVLVNDAYPDLLVDQVVVDPPIGLASRQRPTRDDDDRWAFGTPGRSSGEWAWVQHAIAHLKPGGRAAIITSQSALARGGRDEGTRRRLLRADLIDAVVQLPRGMLGASNAPTCVLIVDNERQNRDRTILFVDASKSGTPKRRKARTFTTEEIYEVADWIINWRVDPQPTNEPRIARSVPITEILDSESNLVPSRYIHYAVRRTQVEGEDLDQSVANLTSTLALQTSLLTDAVVTAQAQLADLTPTSDASLFPSSHGAWTTQSLGDLIVTHGGIAAGMPSPEEEGQGDIAVVTAQDVVESPLVMATRPQQTRPAMPPSGSELLRDGDVILSGLLPPEATDLPGPSVTTVRFTGPAVHERPLIRLRFDESLVIPEYAAMILGSRLGRDVLLTATGSGSLDLLRTKQLVDVQIPMPSIEIQLALVDALMPVAVAAEEAAWIRSVSAQLLDRLREALVNQVLSPSAVEFRAGDLPAAGGSE